MFESDRSLTAGVIERVNIYPPELLGVAGLKQKLNEREDEDEEFKLNWAVVKDWTVESRYE